MELQRVFFLAISLPFFLCGFSSCEPQLRELIPSQTDTTAGMVLIPAGEVLLGAPAADVETEQIAHGVVDPEHTVFVDAFYIDTHEVTIAEFQAFVGATGYNIGYNWWRESTPQHPVFASYMAASAYAEWAGKRLPTASEWEKAARGGLVGQRYPWGNDAPTTQHAHFKSKLGPSPYTVPVGSHPPNGYGLYDMAGNVSEWVAPEVGESLIIRYGETFSRLRGGNWHDGEWYMRNYTRPLAAVHVPAHWNIAGFRCVKDVNLSGP